MSSCIDCAPVNPVRLFATYDFLNELIDAAEEHLLSLHLPRPVLYCYRDYGEAEQTSDFNTAEYLGMTWYGGKLRLCRCTMHPQEENDIEKRGDDPKDFTNWPWRSVRDCHIAVRVEAIKHLDGIRDAVIERRRHFVPEVVTAIDSMCEMLQRWRSDDATAENLEDLANYYTTAEALADYYTAAEAAEKAGVSVRLITRWCREEPDVKAINLGKQWMLEKESLHKFLEKDRPVGNPNFRKTK